MIPRIWLINAVLALCVLFAGASAYRVWVREEPLAAIEPMEQATVPAPERRQVSTQLSSRESAYAIIPERTLFSPNRAESIPEVSEAITEAKQPVISGRRIELHGVIIRGDNRKALIDNPVRDPDEPPRKWVSVGDVLDRLTVLAIEPRSVVLDEGGKRYHHLLDPRTGYPAEGVASVTVIATTCTRADALATAAFVLGRKGLSFLEEQPNTEGLLVEEHDGDLVPLATSGFPMENIHF